MCIDLLYRVSVHLLLTEGKKHSVQSELIQKLINQHKSISINVGLLVLFVHM